MTAEMTRTLTINKDERKVIQNFLFSLESKFKLDINDNALFIVDLMKEIAYGRTCCESKVKVKINYE